MNPQFSALIEWLRSQLPFEWRPEEVDLAIDLVLGPRAAEAAA